MIAFTTGRERRLWLWTVAVVVAIWSTLGLARTLSDELRHRDVLDGSFFLAFVALFASLTLLIHETVMAVGSSLLLRRIRRTRRRGHR